MPPRVALRMPSRKASPSELGPNSRCDKRVLRTLRLTSASNEAGLAARARTGAADEVCDAALPVVSAGLLVAMSASGWPSSPSASGEDWRGTALSAGAAGAACGAEPPDLLGLRVDRNGLRS